MCSVDGHTYKTENEEAKYSKRLQKPEKGSQAVPVLELADGQPHPFSYNERNITMTDTRMMTKRQGFALFCITKKDYRNDGLTYDQASALIKELGDQNYVKKHAVKDSEAVKISQEALEAGMAALNAATPTPMVVEQHANVMDDNSPVTQQWVVDGGVCGFAWLSFKANTTENRKFLAGLKRAGMVGEGKQWSKSTNSGFMYWVSQGGQSMTRKEAFARAYANVLNKYGLTVYVQSRMD